MDILDIPFHRFLNINKVIRDKDLIFRIKERPEYLNHLGTIHACVQLSLAEAISLESLVKKNRESEIDFLYLWFFGVADKGLGTE